MKGNDVFTDAQVFYAKYSKVDGLTSTSMVTFKGVKVGKVKDIVVPMGDDVIVSFTVDNKYQLPYRTIAAIEGDILGTRSIALIVTSNDTMHVSEDTLLGEAEKSISGEVNKVLEPLKKATTEMVKDIDGIIQVTKSIIKDNEDNINNTVDQIRKTLTKIASSASQVDELIGVEADLFAATLESIAAITKNLENNTNYINETIESVAGIADSVQQANITQMLADLEKTIKHLGDISEKINEGDGTMAQLINDSTTIHELNKTLNELNKFLDDPHLRLFGGKKDKKKKQAGMQATKGS